jgi:hypothetical protein
LLEAQGEATSGALSSEVDAGSREKNASKQKSWSPALFPSKPKRL